jgi:hypothetical protein
MAGLSGEAIAPEDGRAAPARQAPVLTAETGAALTRPRAQGRAHDGRTNRMTKTVHIGCAAGFAGDRFDAGVAVVDTLSRRDGPRYLIYEVLAERTLAIAQRLRREDPAKGYSPWLDAYLPLVLAEAKRHGVRIVTNIGAANPRGGARRVLALARELGVEGLRVAVVEGDDLLEVCSAAEIAALPTLEGTDLRGREIVAANAYLGAGPVAEALALGVDVVLVGRTTDSALVLGPLIHEFGWEAPDLLAAGVMAGHLLECGAQVTGGYFADPGFKDVPGLENVGFPVAEIAADGSMVIGKAEHTGGCVTRGTVIEQLLYEVHDPAAYLTPDITLDLTRVRVEEAGSDTVRVTGARGHAAPETLKATISVDGGWLGEGEITYAGPNALARADLAAEVVRARCRAIGVTEKLRVEVIGTGAVHDGDDGARRRRVNAQDDGEYRMRAAVRSADRKVAERVSNEVLSLYCSGPAAGGGVRQSVTPQIATASVLVPRRRVAARAVEVTE